MFESNRAGSPLDSKSDLFLIRPDGTGLRRLTSDGALTAAPSWSADSRSVLLSRQFDRSGTTTFPELFVRGLDGGERRLTNDRWHDWDAMWSPDRHTIAFTSNRPAGGPTFRIHLRHADGRITLVTRTPNGSAAFTPTWLRGGSSLIYALDPDGPVDPSIGYFGGTDARAHTGGPARSRLRVVGADGTGDRMITDGTSSCVTPDLRH